MRSVALLSALSLSLSLACTLAGSFATATATPTPAPTPTPAKIDNPIGRMLQFSFARSVAATRALQSESPLNPYHEPLAVLFAGREALEEKRGQIAAMSGGKSAGRNEVYTVVARAMMVDRMIHEALLSDKVAPHGPQQVVIFGAGFDTRANRFAAHLPVARWCEVDLPAPQRSKEEVLSERGVADPANLVRVAMDLTDGGVVEALEAAGWDPAAPTLYVLEGLLYYMSTADAAALLRSLPCVPRSRIVLSVVERSLQRVFAKRGMNVWSSNYELLRDAGALRLANYRLRRNAPVQFPRRLGLGVWVARPPAGSWWGRLLYRLRVPCERVLEFEAT